VSADIVEIARGMKIGEERVVKTPRGCFRLYKFQYWPQLCRASKRWRERIRRAALSYPDYVVILDYDSCIFLQVRIEPCGRKLFKRTTKEQFL
jgi:hypothetical protein